MGHIKLKQNLMENAFKDKALIKTKLPFQNKII